MIENTMIKRCLALVLGAVLCLCGCGGGAPRSFEGPVALFTAGEEGYNSFRIPAIIRTPEGALLAFCEARKNSHKDHGDIDLVLKRSEDGGVSWGEISPIWNDGERNGFLTGETARVAEKDKKKRFFLETELDNG